MSDEGRGMRDGRCWMRGWLKQRRVRGYKKKGTFAGFLRGEASKVAPKEVEGPKGSGARPAAQAGKPALSPDSPG